MCRCLMEQWKPYTHSNLQLHHILQSGLHDDKGNKQRHQEGDGTERDARQNTIKTQTNGELTYKLNMNSHSKWRNSK